MEQSPAPSYAIPVAIIFGFALIAAAIFFSNGNDVPMAQYNDEEEKTDTTAVSLSSIAAVSEKDFIRGNPNAPIVIVEYADYECVHCLDFHATLKQIMDDYGATGDVAWVFRQFPILGQSSIELAKAAYCVGNLGGSDAYYEFSDIIFTREPGTRANLANLANIAKEAGVDTTSFENCLTTDAVTRQVTDALEAGQAAGIQGTPHSVILVGDQQIPINGAQPVTTVRGIIQTLLEQLGG